MPSEYPPALRRAADARPACSITSSTRCARRPCEWASHSRWLRPVRLGAARAASSSEPTWLQRVAQAAVGLAADQRGALVGRVEAEDHPHRGGLAGAVRADEAGDLPGRDGERHPVQRDGRPEPLAQPGDLDGGFHAANAREPRAAVVVTPAEPSWPSPAASASPEGSVSLARGTRRSHRRATTMTRRERRRRLASAVSAASCGWRPTVAGAGRRGQLARSADARRRRRRYMVLLCAARAGHHGAAAAAPDRGGGRGAAAAVLSLAAFHTLTVAGAVRQLIVAYRLGPRAAAARWPWHSAAVPRCSRSTGPGRADVRVLAVLLAALAPAAAWAGTRAARTTEARLHTAARAGDRRHAGRAHRARRAGPDRPRTARRRRPPHLDGRGAGRDGPADHARACRPSARSGCPRSATPRGPR